MVAKTRDPSYLLACGCSHTSGVGIEPHEIYVQLLADDLGLPLVNLAQGGSCARWVKHTLENYLRNNSLLPGLVVVQWPNPFRTWEITANGQDQFSNVNRQSLLFAARLRQDPDGFWQEWIDSIERFAFHNTEIPIVDLCLESHDFLAHHVAHLAEKDIVLHIDEKLPGKSWIFDSAASDGVHHSGRCHRLWADRLHEVVNELAIR